MEQGQSNVMSVLDAVARDLRTAWGWGRRETPDLLGAGEGKGHEQASQRRGQLRQIPGVEQR